DVDVPDEDEDEEELIPHPHELTFIPYQEPTCTQGGNIACWYCEVCDAYYTDLYAQVPIDEDAIALEQLGHGFSEEWDFNKEEHYRTCVRCGLTTEPEAHCLDEDGK